MDALDKFEAVFEMYWNVFQQWLKVVGEQPWETLGWSIGVRYSRSYINNWASFVCLDKVVEPGEIGV